MNILFFLSEHNYGLTSLLVGQAIPFNQIKGVDFTFVSGNSEKEPGLFQKLTQNNVELLKIDGLEFHSDFKRLVNELISVIDLKKPDFIHVQTNWQLALVAYIKTFSNKKIKIIYTIHGFRHNHKIKSIFARLLIGSALIIFASKVIACSSYTKNKFKLLSSKIDLLYLGVDNNFFNKKNNSDLKIEGKINMIFPGDFRKGKNQELLISSLAKYLNSFPSEDIYLVLPGEGVYKSKCIELAKNLGLSDNVLFPGFLTKEEIINKINNSSIAIIPTNSETFGLCISEPFSSGRCVISRNVGVASDILRNGENGFIFNKNAELYPILNNVLSNRNLIRDCGNNAFLDRMIFNWDSISNEYYNIVKSIKN
jgi:glycosyltransferase involved in cell wall biosynthesis